MAVSQTLTVTEVSGSVNTTANTSKVRILWQSTQTGESWNGYTKTAKYYVSVNGGAEIEYSVSYTLPQSSTKTIVDSTITVAHKGDGTGTVKVRTWMDTGISAGVVEKSSTLTLTTIPRASTLDSLSCSTKYFTGTLTYKYTPKSASFYNRCTVTLNLSGTHTTVKTINLGTQSAAQKTATVTLSASELSVIYNKLPSATTGTLRFTFYTYSDSGYSTQIGSAGYKEVSLSIPDTNDTKPTVSMTLSPVSSLSSPFNSLYIQGYSKVRASFSGSGKYGASIKSYSMTVQGKSYGSPYTTADPIATSGSLSVKGTVTDSRGYTNTVTETITVLPYSTPKLVAASGESAVICERCDSSAAPSESGTYLVIKAKRSYSKVEASGSQKNFCSIRYRYKAEGGSYSSWSTILSDTATSDEVKTGALLSGGLNQTKSYIVQVSAVDTIGNESSMTFTIPTDKVYMHKAGSIRSLGIGKYAEEENMVDIAEDITAKFRGNVVCEGDVTIGDGKLADFPVAEGTNGIWRYRKWNSGIAECWGTATMQSTFQKTWSVLYVCDSTARQNYPFTFAERPTEVVTVRTNGMACFGYVESGGKGMNTTTQTAQYCAARPTSVTETLTFYIDYHVLGRWK